jgi:hypothetical protein
LAAASAFVSGTPLKAVEALASVAAKHDATLIASLASETRDL